VYTDPYQFQKNHHYLSIVFDDWINLSKALAKSKDPSKVHHDSLYSHYVPIVTVAVAVVAVAVAVAVAVVVVVAVVALWFSVM
jgi:hypothetical protein